MHVTMHENMHLVYTLCERARHVAHLIRIPLNRARQFDQDTFIGVLERHGVGEKLVFEKGWKFGLYFFRVLPGNSRARSLGQVPKRGAIEKIWSHRKVGMFESEVGGMLLFWSSGQSCSIHEEEIAAN